MYPHTLCVWGYIVTSYSNYETVPIKKGFVICKTMIIYEIT